MPGPLTRRTFWTALLGCVALLLGAACQSGGEASGGNPRPAEPKSAATLRPGDTLQITLQGIPDPSANDVQVDDEGTVSLPFIGRMPAAGFTPSEFASAIRQAYLDRHIYRNIDVSVFVTDRFVYVGGEVERPGRVVWTPDLTLAKAIQAAGGFTLYAREGAVQLTRGQTLYVLDVDLARLSPTDDPRLFPGDSVNVERSPF